jgi:hypothetical protein
MANLTQSIKLETILFYGQILNITNEPREDYQDPLTAKFCFKFIVNDDKLDECGFIELSQDCNTIKDFINNTFIILNPIK